MIRRIEGVLRIAGSGLMRCMSLELGQGLRIAWLATLLSACNPSVGSESWCDAMEEKPKGDWSTNEATDYAQHCVFRKDDD